MAKSFLYTRGGDKGTTSLRGGVRIAKNSIRVEAYGTVDELNSFIGLVEAHVASLGSLCPERYSSLLREISNRMFDIGAYLSTLSGENEIESGLTAEDIEKLERAIDELDASTPEQRTFILPGGSIASAHAQVARAVCRRAERRLLDLRDSGEIVAADVLVYLNRLSDFMFIFARYLNHLASIPDIPWTPR